MIIRHACRADIPRIVELAKQEHQLSRWRQIRFDPMACAATAAAFISMHGRTMLVSDGGYLAGLVQPLGFTPTVIAMEYGWFATDGSGLALLSRFERWARNMGAHSVMAHNYTNDHRLARVLTTRYGYAGAGQAMCKPLEN